MRSTRNLPAMQIKVGTLISVGLFIALLAMIFPTKGLNPFSSKFKLVAYFENVGGLRPSAPVWFSGVEVGSVKSVAFSETGNHARLKVVMSVESKVKHFIKEDAEASILGLGLMGDTYVSISTGKEDSQAVKNGAVIKGIPPSNLKDEMSGMMDSAKVLLRNLETISTDIAEGRGSIGQLAKDPGLYHELHSAVKELKDFARALNKQDGTVKKIMSDPELYDELVASVKDIHILVEDLKNAEKKLISPETKEKIDKTVNTASRVVKKVGEYQEKIDQIEFDLSFGLKKYEQNISSGHANMHIWPNANRYYMVGIQKINELYGNEIKETTFEAQLAWRILDTPLFIRGGVIKNEFFVAGLDLRLFEDDFKVMLDAYRVAYDPIQMDAQIGVVFLDLIELNAGVENMMKQPFFKGGLTIHYRDTDLINVLLKSLF